MNLRFGLLALALALGGAFASTALAEPPVKEPLESEPQEFAAGEVCDFPIRIEPVGGNPSITFFASGRFHVTGREIVRVTNLDTVESIDLGTQGSLVFMPLPDGNLAITANGRTLIYFLPQDVGGAGLFLVTGRISEILDTASDTITVADFRGRRLDVCAALS